MSEQKPTPSQDRLARKAGKANRLAEIAKRPTTPWLVGRLAALESYRQRPRAFETRLARSSDNMLARSQEMDRNSHERLEAAIGKYQRIKAGEPAVVPQSNEVIGFARLQEIAELDKQATQPPQDPS